ncbi:hypothetical protein BC835DRAFT_1354145 [Cytidiella melzeri]|nr:hypothetical protein BC835DRAFT_1354145 [Cytidiella melzeri]
MSSMLMVRVQISRVRAWFVDIQTPCSKLSLLTVLHVMLGCQPTFPMQSCTLPTIYSTQNPARPAHRDNNNITISLAT